MSDALFWSATTEFVEDLVSSIPAACIEGILQEAYKTAFLFDVPNNILLCFHMNDTKGNGFSNVRMLLEDALKYWLSHIVAPEDRILVEDFLNRNVFPGDGGGNASLEFRTVSKSGEQSWYLGLLFRVEGGKYLFCCKDINSQKQLEALREHCRDLEASGAGNAKYSMAFEQTDLVFLEWDPANGRLDASPGFQRYAAGRYPLSLLKQNVRELAGIYPEDYPRFLALSKDNGEKAVSEATIRVMTVDDEYHWTNVTATVYRDKEGRISRAGYILRDVDELVRTKAALSRCETRFSKIINNLMEGVVIFELQDGKPQIKYVSNTALRFYGVSQEEYRERNAAGETPNEILRVRLLTPAELETLTKRGMVTFSRSSFDYPTRQRYFEAICSVDRQGQERGTYYVVFREITAEQEAREQSRWQQEKYRLICQNSDIITFDYKVAVDELTYSYNLPPDGYREEVVPAFLADIEMSTLFREAQLQAFRTYISAALRGETVEEFEILLNLHRQGFEWYSTKLFGVRDETGSVYRVIGRTQSIQKAKDRQMKRLRSEAVVQVALSSDALFSAAFNVTSGEKVSIAGEVIPEKLKYIQNLSQVFAYLQQNTHPDDLETMLSNTLGSCFLSSDDTSRKRKFECRLQTVGLRADEYRWVQITYMHTFNELINNTVLYIFIMDIDEEKRNLLHITEQVNIDPTTKFLNRAAFERMCQREHGRNAAQTDSLNAMLLLELAVEEKTPGYESLQEVEAAAGSLAETIRLWAQKGDILARLSDTKFLIYLYAVENKVILQERVQSLRRALNHFRPEQEGTTVYMGMTKCGNGGDQGFKHAYNQAELALYAAKKNGDQEVVFYSDTLGRQVGLSDRRRVQIRTFGYFDVFVNHKPIAFKSAKAKELLAILVDRRGGLLSTDEAITYLWEEEPADKVTRSRYRKVAMRLKETLEEYGVEDIVETSGRHRRIVTEKVQCDLFDFVSGKPEFSNLYNGSYLLNYSWGEVTASQLNKEYWTL